MWRLIPAHAGSTPWLLQQKLLARAHPRSRGEHHGPVEIPAGVLGSSPLTRGAPYFTSRLVSYFGLIPAHAGSTKSNPPTQGANRAHPRSRGEHSLVRMEQRPGMGSSPLTRGAPITFLEDDNPGGLIPAHAGSTQSPRAPTCSETAHPRSRGEHK